MQNLVYKILKKNPKRISLHDWIVVLDEEINRYTTLATFTTNGWIRRTLHNLNKNESRLEFIWCDVETEEDKQAVEKILVEFL